MNIIISYLYHQQNDLTFDELDEIIDFCKVVKKERKKKEVNWSEQAPPDSRRPRI